MVNASGLIPLFSNTDIIVVPFHYDLVTVPSTASFLIFIDMLRKAVKGKMEARLIIVPNKHDNRVGKRSELLLWEKTRETFSNYGLVTPKIPRRADMQRFSTMAGLDMQQPIVRNVFDKIYFTIFDTTEPRRKVELTGIQLSANLAKEKSKKKGKAENQDSDSGDAQDLQETIEEDNVQDEDAQIEETDTEKSEIDEEETEDE